MKSRWRRLDKTLCLLDLFHTFSDIMMTLDLRWSCWEFAASAQQVFFFFFFVRIMALVAVVLRSLFSL